MIELSNQDRKYFGLEPVLKHWDKVILKGDTYRPETILYFENNIIKKHIKSTDSQYQENQYNELTDNRTLLLPKTKKGKPKKLTASTLENRRPIGVFLDFDTYGSLTIGNHTTNTSFYTALGKNSSTKCSMREIVDEFIKTSTKNHLAEIENFRIAKRKNIKYKSGDIFTFKLSRTQYGFGRILFDLTKARKKKLFDEDHGLQMLMGTGLLINIYAFTSASKHIDINLLETYKTLPSTYIMDNVIFYGEYEIIGHKPVEISEIDFPISYGGKIDGTPNVFLQWGLIHLELNKSQFKKYILAEYTRTPPQNDPYQKKFNPYGYYSIGWHHQYSLEHITNTINNNGVFDFNNDIYDIEWDLRNPKNKSIKDEIMKTFELDPTKSYQENCKLMNIDCELI